ncbi:hypothetical protein BHE97_08310 [Aeromicrobium sp. PE09-221]|uniref:ECF transporter S component n=1 Tax=Aeromicrobium sp. PE09-221 TaxID=1898043 RepID=UPI000B3EBF7A|nr:ECF transporter S component [Aeromicrobium sp. PE09-221]OUZ10334.1 hypothetical protein BHE97_08310 [Aeromicrobium sp. PE09-221]
MSTRELLVCSAIAVVSSVVLVPALWMQATVAVAVPGLYAVFSGAILFGPVLAQSMLKRGGVALATSLIGALAIMPLTPRGSAMLVPLALQGLFLEALFAVDGYRRWQTWRWPVACLGVGVVHAAGVWVALDLASMNTVYATVTIAVVVLSYLGWPLAALALRSRLALAGVGVSAA